MKPMSVLGCPNNTDWEYREMNFKHSFNRISQRLRLGWSPRSISRIRRDREECFASGQGMLEIIAGLILFVLLTLATLFVSMYLYVQHAVVTAAREGARIASLSEEIGNPSSVSAGVAAVKSHVIDFMRSTTGIDMSESDISVEPPSAAEATGERTVQVEINYMLGEVLPMSDLFANFSSSSPDGSPPDADSGFSDINVVARAKMHYEE